MMLPCFALSLLTPLFFFLRQHWDARRQGDDPAVWKELVAVVEYHHSVAQQVPALVGVTSDQPGGEAIRFQRTWARGLMRALSVFCQSCWTRRHDRVRHDSSVTISLRRPRRPSPSRGGTVFTMPPRAA
jgi:hypothetical protein